jgi:hypothetical protein
MTRTNDAIILCRGAYEQLKRALDYDDEFGTKPAKTLLGKELVILTDEEKSNILKAKAAD